LADSLVAFEWIVVVPPSEWDIDSNDARNIDVTWTRVDSINFYLEELV
jgi:hypothetical protein